MDKTLEAFSAMQRPDDGFGSWGTVNGESCALAAALFTAAFELKCKEREV